MIKFLFRLFIFGLMGILFLFFNNSIMASKAENKLYDNIKKLPSKKAALLLGTAKYVKGGGQNYFYTYRIRAALALWKAKKVKAIIVSGDNGTHYYDETTTMFKDLVKAGVPAKYITKDYAGFRTFDSVFRAEAIFNLQDYIIISQKFHLERALFIAQAQGQKAIGFVAKDIPGTIVAYKMKIREYLARAKAVLDLYILNTQPKFSGKKEKVEYRE